MKSVSDAGVEGSGHLRERLKRSRQGSCDAARTPSGSPARPRNPWRWPRWRPWWTELHQRLAEHPAFAACSREEIRRIARWGDEVEVERDEVLLREDRIGYWFLAILSGRVGLSRGRRRVAMLGPGDHFGDVAIFGLGPQPATAVVATPCRLFILGRQRLVALVHLMPGLQQGLFPGVEPGEYVAHIRGLRVEGTEAWRLLARRARKRASERPERPAWLPRPRVSREAAPLSFSWLATHALRYADPRPEPRIVQVPIRAVAIPVATALAVALVAALFLWHPPVAVISPGEPIEVSADLSVTGVPTYPINGRYVLTPVDIERPTLGGLLDAWVHQRRTQSIKPGGPDADAARRAGREAFADGHRHALAAAEEVLSLPASSLGVRFQPRELQGPSAGLIYAIALVDLLTPEDLARGRTIAATGELTDDGTVIAVGHVREKAAAAHARRAVLFLVPSGQDPDGDGVIAREVASLEEALEILAA